MFDTTTALLPPIPLHRCQLLQWMLPEWFPSKWLMLFTQPWEGDVTMILPAELWLLGKTIVNPTTEELLRSVKVDCRAMDGA